VKSTTVPIRQDGQAQLDELGRTLLSPEFATRRIGLYGHTDAVGSSQANESLSELRAAAVQAYLLQRFRIAAERFDVGGFGESRLKLPATPEDGRNRRVEIVLLD
jgi:outer membrane protein OmpA-like peptidoglycan-associated protein